MNSTTMATSRGSIATFSSFSSSLNFSHAQNTSMLSMVHCKSTTFRRNLVCFAVQETSAAVVPDTKDKDETKKEEKGEAEEAPVKPKAKAAAKAAIKPLPQMMEEDIIPPLKETLQAEEDISELEISFEDPKLEGSFTKKGIPYAFWAFFPDGLMGLKGFSLSSHGFNASTVEPFLVDEKKVTARHVIFWVEKRLAAQGIIPVWKEEQSSNLVEDTK